MPDEVPLECLPGALRTSDLKSASGLAAHTRHAMERVKVGHKFWWDGGDVMDGHCSFQCLKAYLQVLMIVEFSYFFDHARNLRETAEDE